jgi:hypothetical protein
MTLALLIGTPCGVLAQQVGDSLRNHVLLDGKQVPLPHGEWTIFGLGVQDFDMPALGASRRIGRGNDIACRESVLAFERQTMQRPPKCERRGIRLFRQRLRDMAKIINSSTF